MSPELFEALSLFDQWRARTSGALDPAAQVVSELWRRAAAERRTPSADELQAAVATVARPHYRLDAAARTATRLDDAPLILNSFVKSYIANRAAAAAMRAARLDGLVINIGGDLVVRGALAEDVRIADPKADAENDEPLARLLIRNRAVATSGNYRRGVEINGRWYSHIVDPRTALPVDHVISATVVAPQAADAGALATAFCVMAPEESLRMAASLPEVECLLIIKNGKRVESAGWRALEAQPAPREVRLLRRRLRKPGINPLSWSSTLSWRGSKAVAIGGLTSPCGSRTKTTFRCARSRCGIRSRAGFPT